MIPEKSAATQMTDSYGARCNGIETLPWITVLNKKLLEKFGVDVPENLAGKPIVLRDGSGASYTEKFYHLGECHLSTERHLQIMANAKENLLEMTQAQRSFEQGNAFAKLFCAALDQNQEFARSRVYLAASGPVSLHGNEEEKNTSQFEFRQKDAKPNVSTHTDDITKIINTLANSKQNGTLQIESIKKPGTFYEIHKDGNRVNFALDPNNTFSFKFEKNSDSSVTLSEIKSSAPFKIDLSTVPPNLQKVVKWMIGDGELSVPTSIKMWTSPEGEFQFEAQHARGAKGYKVQDHEDGLLNLRTKDFSFERE